MERVKTIITNTRILRPDFVLLVDLLDFFFSFRVGVTKNSLKMTFFRAFLKTSPEKIIVKLVR